MKRPSRVSKGSLSRMFQQAAEAWKRQEYRQTIDILERATRLDPANARTLLDLGRAYGLRYDYAAAECCLEKAVRVALRPAEVLAEAGRRSQEFGNYGLARSYFERAAGQKGALPSVFVSLAELDERHARLAEADQWVSRALAANADNPAALLTQARLARLAGKLEAAEEQLRSLLAKSSMDAPTRIRSWYELGGALDRQGRYDEAMAAFLEAKALLRPAAAAPHKILEGIQARDREMEATISGPFCSGGSSRRNRWPRPEDWQSSAVILAQERLCWNRSWTPIPTSSPPRKPTSSTMKLIFHSAGDTQPGPPCYRYWSRHPSARCGNRERIISGSRKCSPASRTETGSSLTRIPR